MRLTREQIMRLLTTGWGAGGPIRLDRSLSLDALSGSIVLNGARTAMGQMSGDNGVKLTAKGSFNRAFVEHMVDALDWPGWGPEVMWSVSKVVNERDFSPAAYLHAVLDLGGLGRKYRGTFRLTRKGRGLLAPEAAGELNAVLFETTCTRYNLAYLDGVPATDPFQEQIGLTLFLLGRVADIPRSPADLQAAATLPIDPPALDPFSPGSTFRHRVLKYLEWFGLLENTRAKARQGILERSTPLYQKTPLFDRFLSFDIGTVRAD